jgi:hypothetical protein
MEVELDICSLIPVRIKQPLFFLSFLHQILPLQLLFVVSPKEFVTAHILLLRIVVTGQNK